MPSPSRFVRRVRCVLLTTLILAGLLVARSPLQAQMPECDPARVLSADTCAKCHAGEVAVWKKTPHFQTFEQLHRDPRAREIAKKMGQRSIKRGNLCIRCHYTRQQDGERVRAISGISCESCHGAAADWLALHNDYGGPTATRESESAEHRKQRRTDSIAAGMRNPRNLYLVARSCLACHTVPDESLVNQGTHLPGSDHFELVAWSQGTIRHNFVRSNGASNDVSSIERLRVMYIVGQIADLEFSTRATGLATERARFGLTVANRAATVATRLYEIQELVQDPVLEQVLIEFSFAELKINNAEQLNGIADAINQLGTRFAAEADGRQLAAIDSMLPDPTQYR